MIQRLLCLALGVFVVASTASAAPIQYATNGHYYDFVVGDLTWHTAAAQAPTISHLGQPGYLATVTDAAENAFVISSFFLNQSNVFAWLGGREPSDDGNWFWVTGPEAVTQFSLGAAPTAPNFYANWGGIEPNDAKPDEDYLMMNMGTNFAGIASGQWADAASTPNASDPVVGYIIEFIPEPASAMLLCGMLVMCAMRRRQ